MPRPWPRLFRRPCKVLTLLDRHSPVLVKTNCENCFGALPRSHVCISVETWGYWLVRRVWVKSPAFPNQFCFSVCHHIRQLVVQEFLQKGLIIFLGKTEFNSFVFTVLPVHIKIKSLLKYKSVCGRAIKPSGLLPDLPSYNHTIRGSSPDSARLTCLFF